MVGRIETRGKVDWSRFYDKLKSYFKFLTVPLNRSVHAGSTKDYSIFMIIYLDYHNF